jgi:hypothetical protein
VPQAQRNQPLVQGKDLLRARRSLPQAATLPGYAGLAQRAP